MGERPIKTNGSSSSTTIIAILVAIWSFRFNDIDVGVLIEGEAHATTVVNKHGHT